MRLMRRSLAEGDFWSLIDVMRGQVDEDAVARLAGALRARGRRTAVAFQERLARTLFELDREELARQPVRFADDQPDDEPIPLSDDGFLYLRAGIVARGREAFESVVARPAVLADGPWEECEELLYVAEEVVGEDIDTTVSYETGSNTAHWSPRVQPERESWDQGLRPVSVQFQDLARPIEGERPSPDGGWEAFAFYVPPSWLSGDIGHDLSTDLARIVSVHGGLPAELSAHHVVAVVDFGDAWQLEPEIGDPAPSEVGPHHEVRVRVMVASDAVRGWPAAERRVGLSAVAATCVLSVLADDHAARPSLEELRRGGAGLLPA